MTIDEIKAFMPSLSKGELVDLEAAANADADEWAEWLPYYKMALARLSECCGMLRALDCMVDNAAIDLQIREAGKLFYQHLLFGSIGPRRDPDIVHQCEEMAAAARGSFIDGEI
jgi:hypothetical protein